MKELLLFVMLVALCALWYDDKAQRAALEHVQQRVQVEEITSPEYQASHPTVPQWFQDRLHEPPALTTGTAGAYNVGSAR